MEEDITIGRLVEVTKNTMTSVGRTVELPDGSLRFVQSHYLLSRAGERGLVVAPGEASPRRVQVLIGGVPREIRKLDLRPLEGVK